VVTSASAALDDVTRLHQVDPGLDPAVRARRLRLRGCGGREGALTPPRPQVTAATHKRLRGRAAAQLRDAQARLQHVATQARPCAAPNAASQP
jgi:hypothetical protein